MDLETRDHNDFSQGVLRQEDPPLRIQPSRKCKLRPKPTPLDQGRRELTADDRQRLFRQPSAAYKTAHREQQEAGINVFTHRFSALRNQRRCPLGSQGIPLRLSPTPIHTRPRPFSQLRERASTSVPLGVPNDPELKSRKW